MSPFNIFDSRNEELPATLIIDRDIAIRIIRIKHPINTTYHDLVVDNVDVDRIVQVVTNSNLYKIKLQGTLSDLEHCKVSLKDPIGTFSRGGRRIHASFIDREDNVYALPPSAKPQGAVAGQVNKIQRFISGAPILDKRKKPTKDDIKKAGADSSYLILGNSAAIGNGAGEISTAGGEVNLHGEGLNKDMQEENPSMMLMSNFLDHYLIALASAVAFIPMPHLPNLPKLYAIGKRAKSIVNFVKVVKTEIRNL